jgi:putative transposase
VSVAEICRKAGISQATYFNWKKKYAGMLPPEMKKLKQLEDENARLKKIVVDLTLDREMLQDVIRRKLYSRSSHSWSAMSCAQQDGWPCSTMTEQSMRFCDCLA